MIDPALLPDFSRRHGLLIRHARNDRVPFALLEGRLPTRDESRTIVRHGYGLHLLKSVSESDGSAVVAAQPNLKHLMVTGIDLELEWIERLTRLESLSVNGTIASAADLSKLEALDEYGGTTQGAETVFDSPAITHISIDDVREGTLPAIPTQLVRLSLTDLQRTRGITTRLGDPQLQHISLIGSRQFDADSLRPFQRLRSIELTQVVAMSHIDALAALPRLETLSLENCRDLDPIDGLLELDAVQIHVWGRGNFATKLQDLARDHRNWHFQ